MGSTSIRASNFNSLVKVSDLDRPGTNASNHKNKEHSEQKLKRERTDSHLLHNFATVSAVTQEQLKFERESL